MLVAFVRTVNVLSVSVADYVIVLPVVVVVIAVIIVILDVFVIQNNFIAVN